MVVVVWDESSFELFLLAISKIPSVVFFYGPKKYWVSGKKTTFPLSWIWKGNKKEKHTHTPREQWGKEIRVKSIKKWTLTGYMRQPKSNQWRKIQGTIEHKIIQIEGADSKYMGQKGQILLQFSRFSKLLQYCVFCVVNQCFYFGEKVLPPP